MGKILVFVTFKTVVDKSSPAEYGATCVVGTEKDCGAESGIKDEAEDVELWMDEHLKQTGHRRFRRYFSEYVEKTPTNTV